MVAATALLAYLSTLEGKVDNSSDIYGRLNNSTKQTKLDDRSNHSEYGINEEIYANLKLIGEMIDLVDDKVRAITG